MIIAWTGIVSGRNGPFADDGSLLPQSGTKSLRPRLGSILHGGTHT